MSVPQSNCRVTWDRPAWLTECTRRSPGTTPTASSIGRVTRFSTSTGAVPGKSVWRVSVG
jgi:hypothetical protein